MTNDPTQPPVQGEPGAPQEAKADAASDAPKHVDDMIADLRREASDLKDKYLRAHAEMENLRKRAEREKEETAKYAITRFARDLLNVGDNFQRALSAVPAGAADTDPAFKSLLDGVAMTEREFASVLEKNGVKRIDPKGQAFNPHQHQAVMEMPDAETPAGIVLQVFQPGYLIDDRTLRPAMVVVSAGAPKPAEAPPAAAPAGDEPPPAAA
jgi:molecular chaperone GrpE